MFGKDTERCPDIVLVPVSSVAIRQHVLKPAKKHDPKSSGQRTKERERERANAGEWDTTEPVKGHKATISHIEISRLGQRTILDSSLPSDPEPEGGKDQAGC